MPLVTIGCEGPEVEGSGSGSKRNHKGWVICSCAKVPIVAGWDIGPGGDVLLEVVVGPKKPRLVRCSIAILFQGADKAAAQLARVSQGC